MKRTPVIMPLALLGFVALMLISFLDMNIWSRPADPLTARQVMEAFGAVCCLILLRACADE